MPDTTEDHHYRELIDRLVSDCRAGQGQVGANKVRRGVWNVNASAEFLPDQHAVNEFLTDLSAEHRELVAHMLADQYVGGIHAVLVALYEAEVPPFDKGYEGDPFHDFVGRLDDWDWPIGDARF